MKKIVIVLMCLASVCSFAKAKKTQDREPSQTADFGKATKFSSSDCDARIEEVNNTKEQIKNMDLRPIQRDLLDKMADNTLKIVLLSCVKSKSIKKENVSDSCLKMQKDLEQIKESTYSAGLSVSDEQYLLLKSMLENTRKIAELTCEGLKQIK